MVYVESYIFYSNVHLRIRILNCSNKSSFFYFVETSFFTRWLDRDNPSVTADNESLQVWHHCKIFFLRFKAIKLFFQLHSRDLGPICRSEDLVEDAICRIVGGNGTLVGDLPDPQLLDPNCTREGLVCVNASQPDGRDCFDYEISFKCTLLNRQQGPQQPVVYGNYFQSEEEGVHVIYMPGAEPTPEPTPDPSNNETETGNQQTNSLVGGGSQGQFIYMFDGDKVRNYMYIDWLRMFIFH